MSRTGQTISVIDDDESVRRALRRLLRSVGWNVESFATAEEFLQSPGQPAPRCLVLDVHLPGMSGLELQKQLQAEGRAVAVVFITAYADDQMRELALGEGAIALLQKPFEEQSLLDAVDQAVGG
jgi:FixJ family two-component response regulator